MTFSVAISLAALDSASANSLALNCALSSKTRDSKESKTARSKSTTDRRRLGGSSSAKKALAAGDRRNWA